MAVDERINLYGIAIQEQYNGGLELYGIGIENPYQHGLELYGMAIDAMNVFNGIFTVVDNNFNPIPGVTVTLSSSQTLPGNFTGNIDGITDNNGGIIITGSSTVGTVVTLEKEGFNTTKTGLQGSLSGDMSMTMTSITSKKVFSTNKGNIMINPNDTILIELD